MPDLHKTNREPSIHIGVRCAESDTANAMSTTPPELAFIGFGEAAMAFCADWEGIEAIAYDIKVEEPRLRADKLDDYERAGVVGADTLEQALGGARLVVSVVTADQALEAARAASMTIASETLYCDFNSVAPETKRAAAEFIHGAGARYVDVAVMAPVLPLGTKVPLLGSGPHVAKAKAALAKYGFALESAGDDLGRASTIKMVRSAMVKGLEALSAECGLAAMRAGVVEEVIASLHLSHGGTDWERKVCYDLGRMIEHGERRAAEMEEVAKTLDELGTGSVMTRASAERQREIGRLGLVSQGNLVADAAAILERRDAA